MRNFLTNLVVPFLKLTGFRFSKDYRHGRTLFHRVVYSLISTPAANIKADFGRWISFSSNPSVRVEFEDWKGRRISSEKEYD